MKVNQNDLHENIFKMTKNSSTPKRKRLNEKARLKCGRDWINSFRGKSIVLGYARWFGVDKICAINELKKLNVIIPEDIETQIRKSIKIQIEFKANRKKQTELKSIGENDSDENFAFIAGYTSGGMPYGLKHSESEVI